MEESEKLEILRQLQAGRDALGEAVAGVHDDRAARKPASGGWSILDCVEHVVVTEQYLLTRLQVATVVDKPFEKWRRAAKIAALAADRSRRIEAPEQAHPRGRYRTLGDALEAFDGTRAEVARWVEKCNGDPRCMITDHLLIEGPVTCAEMLIMISAHPTRHAQQITALRLEFAAKA